MSNPFDQFDAVPQTSGNPFDQFDAAPASPAAPLSKTRAMLQPWVDAGNLVNKGIGKARETVEGVVEPLVTMGTGVAGAIVGPFAALGKGILTGDVSGDKFEKNTADIAGAMTYMPRSESGQKNLRRGVELFDESKLAGLPIAGSELGVIGRAASQQLPRATAALEAGAAARVAEKAPTRSQIAASRGNAPAIRINENAKKYGISLPPSDVNPTVLNRARDVMSAEALPEQLVKKNEGVVDHAIRHDMGLLPEDPLDLPPINRIRAEGEVPADKIRQLGTVLDATGETAESIEKMIPPKMISGAEANSTVGGQVSRAKKMLSEGMTASQILDNIRDLRQSSRDLLSGKDIAKGARAEADAALGVSNALEDLLDRRLGTLDAAHPEAGYGKLMDEYRAGRTRQAKSYVLEDIISREGKIIPEELSKRVYTDKALSGAFQEVGDIIDTHPTAFKAQSDKYGIPFSHYARRGGIPGALGAAIGAASGIPGAVPIGSAIGAGAGILGSSLLGRSATSRAVQRGLKTPDFRPFREQLGYGPVVPDELSLAALRGKAPPAPYQGFKIAPENQYPSSQPAQSELGAMTADMGGGAAPVRFTTEGQPKSPVSEIGQFEPLPLVLPESAAKSQALRGYVNPDEMPMLPVEGVIGKADRSGGYSTSAPDSPVSMPRETPLPGLPPVERPNMLSVTDENIGRAAPERGPPIKGWKSDPNNIDSKLREEVMNDLAPVTDALRQQLQDLYDLRARQSGMWRVKTEKQIAELEQYMRDGLKQVGITGNTDPARALYQSGKPTQLPIE